MNLEEKDQKYIWHPLTQHQTAPPALLINKAKEALLFDAKGNSYIDGISSWYTAVYGHCNPYILTAAQKQMEQLDQIIFSGFTHEPAVRLSEKLISILPNNQAKLFFSDNGSTATEIGIKMALQYHFNRGSERHVILAFEDAFHGDTFGAMSASGLSVYNGPFEKHFIEVIRIPVPNDDNITFVIQHLKELISNYNIAGFIFEPLVQGAAGMKMYKVEHLDLLLAICKEHQIITVADEVMTGFGKTGTHFASDQLHVKPDVICMSKALTAGFVPMAVTSCTQFIYEAFLSNDVSTGLFHAHTYTANSIACSVASAAIDLLTSKEIQQNKEQINSAHLNFAKEISKHPKVKNARVKGVILAFELDNSMERYGNKRNELYNFFMEQGVYLRPLGNTIYCLPPYIITPLQLKKIYSAIELALEKF